jgi:hypothetical protein
VGRYLRPETAVHPDNGKIRRNRHIATLSAVYTKAVGEWFGTDRNPCSAVVRHPEEKRRRYASNEEYAAFYALADERVQIAMDLTPDHGTARGRPAATEVGRRD